jgi:hypothetical protein
MKQELQELKMNLPKILSFVDYHEIKYIEKYINEFVSKDTQIKSKEIMGLGSKEYYAIFYLEKDEVYDALIKEFYDDLGFRVR